MKDTTTRETHSGKWLKGHCPRSVCSAQEQGRAKEIVLPSTFIRSETESRFALNGWIKAGGVTSSTSGRRVAGQPGGEMETGRCTQILCGRGGSRVSGKERRVKFGREKKKGKRNGPGKAQSINGCGAEVKYSWVLWSGSGQARVIFHARGGVAASCGIKITGNDGSRDGIEKRGGV